MHFLSVIKTERTVSVKGPAVKMLLRCLAALSKYENPFGNLCVLYKLQFRIRPKRGFKEKSVRSFDNIEGSRE